MKVQDIVLKENHDFIDEGLGKTLAKKAAQKYKDRSRAAKRTRDAEIASSRNKVDRAAAQLKYEKALEAAKKAAAGKLSSLPSVALNALNLAFTAEFLREWYAKLIALENEYQAFLAGDKETNFGDATPEEGFQLAQERRRKLLGEASAVILVNLGVLSTASKFLGYISGGVGKAVGGVVGGRLGGEAGKFIASLPFSVTQKIAKLIEGGPAQKAALTAFIASPEAQKFLSYITFGMLDIPVKIIRDALGLTAEIALDGLNKGLEKLGVTAPDMIKTKITAPTPTPGDTATGYQHDLAMSVQRDPKNPKILYVDRVAITDKDGYQDVGNATLADIKNRANILGRADPTSGIPKKPGKDYNY
jgi:hypothetical protein